MKRLKITANLRSHVFKKDNMVMHAKDSNLPYSNLFNSEAQHEVAYPDAFSYERMAH